MLCDCGDSCIKSIHFFFSAQFPTSQLIAYYSAVWYSTESLSFASYFYALVYPTVPALHNLKLHVVILEYLDKFYPIFLLISRLYNLLPIIQLSDIRLNPCHLQVIFYALVYPTVLVLHNLKLHVVILEYLDKFYPIFLLISRLYNLLPIIQLSDIRLNPCHLQVIFML